MACILFVSGYYPPHAPSGAVRPPKLVKHWRAQGHDVRVLAIDNRNLGQALGADADAQVAHLPYGPPKPAADPPEIQAPTLDATGKRPGWLRIAWRQAHTVPDRYAGWVEPATAAAVAWSRSGWRPDVIVSSGPPQRSHVVAARLTGLFGSPWIAELRDLWVGNPYSGWKAPVRWWSDRLGRRTLRHAAAFVAVTEGAAAELRRQHPERPVVVAMNGFDPEDFGGLDEVAPLDPERLTIIHAGVMYARRRDPAALIGAVAMLDPAERDHVTVRFYHDEFGYVRGLVAANGVEAQVEMHGLVPRADILRIERAADVMLLCRWSDPLDDAVIPGKLFEYIGARRPILAVGSETGEAAAIVRAGPFGLVSNDPASIAAQLRCWLADKIANGGRLADLSAGPTAPYIREKQFRHIDALIARICPTLPAPSVIG